MHVIMEWMQFGREMDGIVNESPAGAKIWSQVPCSKDTEKTRIHFVGTFPLLCDLNLCAAFKLNKTSVVPSTEHGN